MNDWRSYDSTAESYERLHSPVMGQPSRDLVELADVSEGARVLDVGTGTGVAARAAAEAAGPSGFVVGIDPSLPMLLAGDRSSPGHGAVAEAIDLPFRDATFDVVTANCVLAHFKKYKTALFDMLRVLRPEGTLAVSSWGNRDDEFRRTWTELVEGVVGHDMLLDASRQVVPWEDLFADPHSLEEVLAGAGLRKLRVERREYKHRTSLEDYLSARETATAGRFVRSMLSDDSWESFRKRARETFAERFPDPLTDFSDAILAVGTKR